MSDTGPLDMPRIRSMFRIACCAVFCWMTMDVSVSAQEKPLKLSIRREWEGARSSAPLSLRAFAKWQRSELLEGRLHIQAYVDTQRISSWTGNEISLSDSEQFVWLMSPRPILTETARYALQTELLSNRAGLDLEMLDVEVPVRSRRVLVVALIVEHGTSTPAGLGSRETRTAFEEPLTLQNYVSAAESQFLHLHLSRVEPKDFPDQPLRLTGLDAVMVPHDMMGRLKSSQLESLRRWVSAGGSMLVIRAGQITESADEWLRDLSLSPWPRDQLKSRQLPDSLSIFDVGLGQLLVIDQALDGASAEWARTAGQLLRMRTERTNEILFNRSLSTAPTGAIRSTDWENLEPRGRITLEDSAGKANLQRLLLPESIRGMPFWLAASVLGLCLLCIGPLDYWVLGALRKRRWTWVLFPLVALGFTGWMAQLAADHNGSNDARHWLSIVDVTPAGEVLRTSRLELTYGASGRVVPHEVANQWWCDLRAEDLKPIWDIGAGPRTDQSLEYAGSVPGKYVVAEPVQQWTTRMQRITTLGADPELAGYSLPRFDWKPIESACRQREMTNPKLVSMLDRLAAPNPNTRVGLTLPGGVVLWNTPPAEDDAPRLRAITEAVLPELLTGRGSEAAGIFHLLTELSPTAGPDCEDLVLTSRRCGLILQQVESGRYLLTRIIFPTAE